MAKMKPLTDTGMRAAATDKDQWLSRPFARGAGVFLGRITPAGERLFYFRYTDTKGRRPFLPIGAYSSKSGAGLTVAEAGEKAAELSALYRSGVKDLREHLAQQEADRLKAEDDARRTAEAARLAAEAETAAQVVAAERRVTVRRLFDQWQRVQLTPHTLADGTRTGRKDGGEWVRQSFERRVFPKLGAVAAEDVRKAELLTILDECKAEGRRRTANVLLTDLNQMFRFAAEREIVARNPLEGIKRASVGGKDTERDRTLTPDELRALAKALPLANMGPRSVAALWLILSTACRVGEALGARWEHVDIEARRWYLPETKNERDHTIHLSDFALVHVQALAELREVGPDDKPTPWVFPSTAGTGPVCPKSLGKQLADRQRTPDKRMTNRAKNTTALMLAGGRWTAHDLRRTAATIMASIGISTDTIDECLNHKLQSKVARVYIKDRRLTEQARAFDALGARLQEIISGEKAASNVVALHAA